MSKHVDNNLTNKKFIGALAAGAASLYGQADAEAGIQYTDSTASPVISDKTTVGTVPWDIDGDLNADVNIHNSAITFASPPRDIKKLQGLPNSKGGLEFAVNNSNKGSLAKLSLNAFVNSQTFFQTAVNIVENSSIKYAEFTSGDPGYFGFRFRDINSSTSHYGWAKATLTADGTGRFGTFEISEWAYNDVANASITVGQTTDNSSNSSVPEPSSFAITGLGLLAAGFGGVRRWRRDRKQKAV